MALRPKAWSDSGGWKTIPDLTQSEPGWAKGEPKQTDLRLWRETCGELRGLMKEIFELKIKKGSKAEVEERRIQASLLFVTLKKLNRIEKLRFCSV